MMIINNSKNHNNNNNNNNNHTIKSTNKRVVCVSTYQSSSLRVLDTHYSLRVTRVERAAAINDDDDNRIVDGRVIHARGGGHPRPSDCFPFCVVTGPNMSGKSTYIRQVAVLVILAHAGSFVPASFFSCPDVDAVYTRIGTGAGLSPVASV